ncbi:MAG: hypothetical protein AAF726_21905 [Planctomycetota bacterium]
MWTVLTLLAALFASHATPPVAATLESTQDSYGTPPRYPIGVGMTVFIRGELTPYVMTFYEDGTWEVVDGDQNPVGWGIYVYDEDAGTIDYLNESGDGGGGQTGTYTGSHDSGMWERTAASHPKAPELALQPPH